MGSNETIADIIREMRNLGKLDEKCCDMIPRSLQGLGLRTYADRIEAAAARDKAAAEAEALSVGGLVEATRHKAGNVSALRGALEKIKELNRYDLGCIRSIKRRNEIDAKVLEIERTVRAALSAPARNCDLYPTLAEAVLASGECTAEAPSLFGMGNAQLVRFARWLFAKAEGIEATPERIKAQDDTRALLREARAAIGEGEEDTK